MEENSPVKGTHDTSITVIDWPPPGDTAIEREREREREREAEEEDGVHPPHCNFGDRRGGGDGHYGRTSELQCRFKHEKMNRKFY